LLAQKFTGQLQPGKDLAKKAIMGVANIGHGIRFRRLGNFGAGLGIAQV
jgi:hypothetical protein